MATKPTRKGVSNWWINASDTALDISARLPPIAERANGDLMLLTINWIGSTTTLVNYAALGWVRIKDVLVGSRHMETYARKYSDTDPISVYQLTKSSAQSNVYVIEMVGSHGVGDIAADILTGPSWPRPSAGSTVQMPSITTPAADYLAIGYSGEATNFVGGLPTLTAPSGFTSWHDRPETAGVSIEQINVYYKEMPAAGPTGTPITDYGSGAGTNQNGGGYQIAIPPKADTAIITTGQVKVYGSFRPSATEVVIGNKKLVPTGLVEAILYDAAGTTEQTRVTVTHDSVTKWGNARFTGLLPGTSYLVRFAVNGTLQTDCDRHPKTLRAPETPVSIKFVTGSCQFTGSNHPVFDRIREENPMFLAHMGDLHYVDATEETAWRAGMEASLSASKFNQLLDTIPMSWSMDNHDRIMTNPGGAGTALNLGETDPKTAAQWKHLAGSQSWASPDGLGQAWQVGRVLFVSLDMWSARDDPDFDPEPRTFLGATQKDWFKKLLWDTKASLIVWFSQWTNRNNANGRWNSFPAETSELELFFNAYPSIRDRMVMIGGDSHSPQAGDGDYGGNSGFRFLGIPSLNFSGFNRSGDAGDGSVGWNIINEGGRPVGSAEADYGLYSAVQILDDGNYLRFIWEGKKVDAAGVVTRRATFERSFGQDWQKLIINGSQADSALIGDTLIWKKDVKGVF